MNFTRWLLLWAFVGSVVARPSQTDPDRWHSPLSESNKAVGFEEHDVTNVPALTARGSAIIDIIVDVATSLLRTFIVGGIFDAISNLIDKQHATESAFTQGMVSQLRRQFPNKNVLVYHKGTTSHFVGASHSHQEVSIGLGKTQGYEVWVLDSGVFTRIGDGGYINWCYNGNYVSSGNTVTFKKISSSSSSLPAVASAPKTPPVPPLNTPSRTTSKKVRQDVDGFYLVDCHDSKDQTNSSGVAYYRDFKAGGNQGEQPDDYQELTQRSNAAWGSPGAVAFRSANLTLSWNIFNDAQAQLAHTLVGAADDTYEHFWVYRAAGAELFQKDGATCSSVYWAF